MEQWLKSVYSDGSPMFLSEDSPSIGDRVAIRLQVYEDAPVKHVFVRTVPDGAERLDEAKCISISHGLKLYEAIITVTEERMNYQFYLVCDNIVYFYTQNGITTYIPDHTYDFVISTSYKQPKWVKESVFYQIFPERFCNGRPEITVKNDEYECHGYKTIRRENFEDDAYFWDEGHAVDFHGGDLYGIMEKLPYLKELGVNAIYLNPIFTAPSTHKYDCADYFHVDPHFGGDEALAELCNAVHENGMRIILDISINHTGTEHVWFKKALADENSEEREYYFFDGSEYKGWFDNKSLPVLNYTSEKLKGRIYKDEDSVLKKWLKPPYSIDGWRFDVADVFARNGKYQLNRPIWEEIRKEIRKVNPEAYILAEDWGDCGTYLQGNEWDSPMNYYGFGRIVRQYMGCGDLFMIRNEILAKVDYKMTANDVEARIREHLAKIPYVIWENQFNLIDSHDVPRIQHEGISDEMLRGSIVWQYMMVGTPCIYYGDEASIGGFTHQDAGFRFPMPWSKEEEFKKHWTFMLYKTLSELKRTKKVLQSGSMKILSADDDCISIARFNDKEAYVMVMNHNAEERTLMIEVGPCGMTQSDSECEITEVTGREINIKWEDKRTLSVKLKANETILINQQKTV